MTKRHQPDDEPKIGDAHEVADAMNADNHMGHDEPDHAAGDAGVKESVKQPTIRDDNGVIGSIDPQQPPVGGAGTKPKTITKKDVGEADGEEGDVALSVDPTLAPAGGQGVTPPDITAKDIGDGDSDVVLSQDPGKAPQVFGGDKAVVPPEDR